MKLIFVLVFLVIVGISAVEYKKQTLNEWYQQVNNEIINKRKVWNHPFKIYFEGYSHWSIKQFMEFEKNKNKELNFAEAMILIYGSGLKHFSEFKRNNAWNAMIDALVDFYKPKIHKNELNCFKLELNKLDPDSSLLKGFDESRMNNFVAVCESIVDMNGLESHITNVEEAYGDLATLTGGAIDRNKFKKILLTLILLGGETIPKMYKGTNLLIQELKAALDTAFDATLSNLENRPSLQQHG